MMPVRSCLLLLSLFSVALDADVVTVSDRVYDTVSTAQRLLQQDAYQGALDVLAPALDDSRLNAYEHALLQRIAGAAAIGVGDYPTAAVHFEGALESEFLPIRVDEQLRYRLARLYVDEGRYDDALSLSTRWLDAAVCPQARLCFLIASIYASTGRWSVALEWAERGLVQSDSPSERRYALVADLSLAANDTARAAELLELLVHDYPDNARYWRQLLALHVELGFDERAIAVAELGYLRGVLSSVADIERLAVLYLHADVPGKAARLLEELLRRQPQTAGAYRYQLLARAWFAAREYARAVTALETASGYPRDADPQRVAELCLLEGVAHLRLSQPQRAERAFTDCLRFDTTRESASRWIDYLARQAGS